MLADNPFYRESIVPFFATMAAMNKFEQMRAFVGVVEAGGYSSAERSTGMSRAVLSRNVIDLEQRLGVTLLERTTRTVLLTEEGRLFYEQCRTILEDLQTAERIVSERSAEPLGELRIAAPVNFGLSDLGPAFAEFLRRYAKVRIRLTLSDHPADPAAEGVDIAIRVGDFSLPVSHKLSAYRITTSTRIVCASPEYLARKGVPERPHALSSHDCLCYSYLDEPDQWSFRRGRSDFQVRVASRIVTSAASVLRSGAIAGLGVAYGPEQFFQSEIADGRLVRLLQDYRLPEVAIYSISPEATYANARVAAFNEFMRTFLSRPKNFT